MASKSVLVRALGALLEKSWEQTLEGSMLLLLRFRLPKGIAHPWAGRHANMLGLHKCWLVP